jgi:AbrB family looped-hinge helix DNA binding protein
MSKNVVTGCECLIKEGEAMEFTAYVRKEGRITLPKEVRDALSIREGNLVKCQIEKVKTQK